MSNDFHPGNYRRLRRNYGRNATAQSKMTSKLTESAIEELAIERLQRLGYSYLHGSIIAFDGSSPERTSYTEVILNGRLRAAVDKINPHLPADVRATAIKEVQRIHSPELLVNNEAFHRMLTEGERVWLIDFDNPLNNDFLVVNQFTVLENHFNKRPDLILFVNGIPLVVIELKNAADENTTLHSAFQQLETYKATIPSLFTSNAFNVISDGFEAKAGSISAGFTRFMAWSSRIAMTSTINCSIPLRRPSSYYAKIRYKPRIGTI